MTLKKSYKVVFVKKVSIFYWACSVMSRFLDRTWKKINFKVKWKLERYPLKCMCILHIKDH